MATFTLADLKKRSESDFGKLTAALTKKTEYSKGDEGFWKPTQDKAGNATATIRFLPAHPDDDLAYVQYYDHSFQHGGKGGKWYIEHCPTTVGRDECPVCTQNKKNYQAMSKEEAKKVSPSRRLNYISNILVIKDPANPDNDGKVFRFKYGKKIKDKIDEKLTPAFEDVKPVNIYDPFRGADFRLHLAIVDKYPSYDKSQFGDVKPISEDDEEVLRVVNEAVSLKAFVAEDKFKTKELLQKRYDFVTGSVPASTQQAEELVRAMTEEVRAEAKPKAKAAPTPKSTEVFDDVPDDADLEKYFEDMAK